MQNANITSTNARNRGIIDGKCVLDVQESILRDFEVCTANGNWLNNAVCNSVMDEYRRCPAERNMTLP